MDSQVRYVMSGMGEERIRGQVVLLFAIPSLVPTKAFSCFSALIWGISNWLMATEAVGLASGTDW